MYKGVIFDLDGTLLNTIDDLAYAVNHTLENNGEPVLSTDTVRSYVGNGNKNLMARSLPGGFDHPDFDRIFDEYLNYYLTHADVYTKPYEGISEVLSYCNKNGIPIAVNTSKVQEGANTVIKAYFPDNFAAVIGDGEGRNRKPAPDGVEAALKVLGTKKEETLYVGDSPVDYNTAKNSGVDCALCLWGFCDEQTLRALNPEIILETPGDIFKYL